MKIYGVCDSGYTTPFIQEVLATKSKNRKSYRVSGDTCCFGFKVYVRIEDASLSPREAQQKWSNELIERATELESRAAGLRERAKLKLKVVSCK